MQAMIRVILKTSPATYDDPSCRVSLNDAAKHPGRLFMDLHALGQQVSCDVVMRAIGSRENGTRRPHHSFLTVDQLTNHFLGCGHAAFFLDRGSFRKVAV